MKTIHKVFLLLALIGIFLPCSQSQMDLLSIFSISISLVIIIIIFTSIKTPAQIQDGRPQKQSVLKDHSGRKLKVEASFEYGQMPGTKYATLFSYPGGHGIELIYCYTGALFKAGDEVGIEYHELSKSLTYSIPTVTIRFG